MITREEIENIAMLSKLSVDESKIDSLIADMQKIIDFADTINNAEESEVEFDGINNLCNALRTDEIRESYDVNDILKNAKDIGNDHFLVRKKA